MITGLTLCSGGGLAALGLRAAGVRLVGAVEYDPAIAAVYAANLGAHCTVAPVQDVDYRLWAGIDVLQVSPPCPSFSVAKAGGQETALDTAIAAAIVRAITTIRPRVLWLENVEGYAGSASYRAIRAALDSLNYWSHAAVVNSADYGVPQTRRRLILRAVSGGLWQPFRPLPAPVPWVGWYAAIADLIPTLPDSAFAPWQLARLPAELTTSAIFSNQQSDDRKGTETGYGVPYRRSEEPALTLRTGVGNIPRAFLVDGFNGRMGTGEPTWRTSNEPAMTVPASHKAYHRAWLDQGRVVRLTPRALARFQSVPDSYQLPASNALACRVIGNGVPVLVAQAVTASLLDVAEVAA